MKHLTRMLALAVTVPLLSCRPEAHPLRGASLLYEPSVVELTGTVTLENHYGPPNFGENPQTDEKMVVPVLALSAPVSVKGDSTSELDRTSVTGVRRVQLDLTAVSGSPSRWANTRVVVTGTLSHAISGQDFTDVVLHVRTVRRVS